MEVSGQLHASAALSQGKSPWYPLDRRLGGPQNQSTCLYYCLELFMLLCQVEVCKKNSFMVSAELKGYKRR
jgi:hypothetical protein